MTRTKPCPYCAEEIRSEAIKCRYCASRLDLRHPLPLEWTRKEEGRMVAGVCSGLSERFDVSVTVLRLAFVVGALFSFGTALILYAILWVVMPIEEEPPLLDEPRYTDPPPPVA